MTRRAALVRLAWLLVTVGLLTSCGPDYTQIPLPGSGVKGDTYELTATFDEALNLSQGAAVKVNGISVGKVQSVTADDFKAKVLIKLQSRVQLHADSTARLRYDTPLGELFIQIDPSDQGALLKDGDSIARKNTSTAPTVEDTLASASLLVNGGGLGQLQVISTELIKAFGGRENTIRDVLARTTAFLHDANASSADFDRVLSSLQGASKVLAARNDTIDRALKETIPFSQVLRANTDDIVKLLESTDTLAGHANTFLGKSRQALITMLEQLDPILREILSTKSELGPGLSDLVKAADLLDKTVPGDFLPLDAVLDVNGSIPSGLPSLPTPTLPIPTITLPIPTITLPTILPSITLPTILPSLPLPSIPGLPLRSMTFSMSPGDAR